MSSDHDANRRAANASLGIDASALDRLAAPVQLGGVPGRADAAVNAPAIPHGGNGMPGGLQELRTLAGDVASGVASRLQGFMKPTAETPTPVAATTRVLPACLRVVKLTGGSETVGYPLRGAEHIVHAFVAPSGDLQVEHTQLTGAHELVTLDLERRLFAALPHHPATEAETDPQVIARLLDLLGRETAALRDYVGATINKWGDPALPRLVAALLLWSVQDLRLSPADAARGFLRSWRGPAVVYVGRDRLDMGAGAARATSVLLDYAKLDLSALVLMAAPFARGPFVYGGASHASAARDVEAERAARVSTVETAAARETFLDTTRVVTPRSAALIVARRIVDPSRVPFADVTVVSPEIRIGRYSYLLGARRWPAFAVMPGTTVVHVMNGVEVGFEVLGDEESIELSERTIERGAKARAGRGILDSVLAAARATVAESAPAPITEFVSMRDRSEAKRRMAVLRAHLERVADIYTSSADPYTASLDRAVVLQLATVGLRLDPALVEHEIRKRDPGSDVLDACFAIARDPRTWIFLPDEAAAT